MKNSFGMQCYTIIAINALTQQTTRFSSGLISYAIICEIPTCFSKEIFQEHLCVFLFRNTIMLKHAARIPYDMNKSIVMKKGEEKEEILHMCRHRFCCRSMCSDIMSKIL